jgi:glycosyltransferase involved in cell wall biosynthesis
MSDGRQLLIISYHFPPDAAVGAVRPAKFAKYLSRAGWQPYILTVKERCYPATDSSLVHEVNHLPTIRTRCWPTLLQLAVTARHRVRRSASSPPATVPSIAGSTVRRAERPGLSFHIKRYLNSILELPDPQRGWIIPAVWAAYRLVRKHRIRIVLVSSPPRTTALVGLALSYLLPIRLVTDLRDPWFTPYFEQGSILRSRRDVVAVRSAIGDAIERWLEKKIVERSARVITTTEDLAVILRRAYPSSAGRISAITNGYDPEDLAAIEPPEPGRKFTFSHLGSFLYDRTPRPFFEALSELIREGRLSASSIDVSLTGHVLWTTDGRIEDLVAAYGLGACVRVAEPVSYQESLRQMSRSHALLLFTPKQYCSIPSKTFEYLAARKPILCMAEEGATADLINSTCAGFVVQPEDVEAIKAGVMNVVDAFRNARPVTSYSDVSKYDRKALADQLARHFVELM